MPFQTDHQVAEVANGFGEYLVTFLSSGGQVRADLFRKGKLVEAHVSFPTGIDAGSVTDPYVKELWKYALEHQFPHFRIVLS